ncbi:iron complex outermembrane recepter protein [Maribacter sedimenticola]|uniref:Iron complex outermembrane recepter protein n=1 Tax=Maribacter sedimenticola TaxID=228956 RepID=A0ABY1SHK9_9FLAO|nr:TonB-dependent receptor [Maribacter sedimenticola]SNR48118.1 iron complex outermembrane recepter protein [Maribacter sedimenticola]
MRTNKLMKTLLAVLLISSSINMTAANKLDKEVTLDEFLNEISEKYEVFFTYNPTLVASTSLNPEEYKFPILDKIINKLERKTSFDFEYLGNKYYVVYHKKNERAKVLKVDSYKNGLSALTLNEEVQNTITGKVTDASGMPLAGVNIVEKGTTNGTTSDFDGNYSINITDDTKLVFSYIGFATQEIATAGKSTINVQLTEGMQLDEFIVVGSRTAPRSNTDTPLPVDVVGVKELNSTGQVTFDKALQYRIPSFNTVQTPVNDATSLLDPYEIRNMGPSRTLILINGKRKNLSALLYTQTSPGRGETGADISAIPTDAIKRVEILRDGASAQYGSDAIAGVMNIILKDSPNEGSATVRTGITSEGDGEMFGVAVNNGSSIADDKGFVNYTVDFSKVNLANRPGTVNAAGEAADFGADIADVQSFLSRRPDAGNINGSPETAAAKFSANFGYDLSENTSLYANAAYVYKAVNSFANYRTPYWRTVEDFPYLADFFPGNNPNTPNGYDGYVPTFEGLLSDYNGTVGFKSTINDWNIDASFTTGGNLQTYKVNQSHNRNVVYSPSTWVDANGNGSVDDGEITEGSQLYRENSQQSFDPGGTKFTHNVGNIDISRLLSDKVSIGVGAEFRTETFEVIEGELASYDGGGADSFAGASPQNSGKFNRYNIGGYLSLDYDVTDAFLLSGTIRTENYSDFGNAFVYKFSSRYKVNDAFTLRGSISSGFRAPTLHQIYTQKAQYSFVPGQGIQVGGLINNVSTQAKLLGIPQLDAETSTNFTVGFGGKIANKFSYTLDYYNIAVKDRIVLGSEIGPSGDANNPLDILLADNNLSDVSFFSNAIDTKTSGIDVVLAYKGIDLGAGSLDLNLSGNYTIQNERDGPVKDVPLVANSGQSVVNETQEALFFTSRPKTKWILGANYDINKFGISLNNTYFGKTTFQQQGMDNNIFTEFTPKIVTDLGVNFSATDKLTLALNINNILNVLPEWSFKSKNAAGDDILADPAQVQNQSNLITFNQRYSQMTYDGYHFSQLGTMFNLSLNYKF